jgi:hypothetical protein
MAGRRDGVRQHGKAWRGVLLAGLLVALPAQGSAQCAWVLWQESSAGSGRWKLDTDTQVIFQSQRECEQKLKDRLQSLARVDPGSKAFLVCLPDTIDPRGPKYGKR